VNEASTLALDRLVEPFVEPWLGSRKIALLVTPSADDLPHHGRNERFQP
jgi:hypothetical protein